VKESKLIIVAGMSGLGESTTAQIFPINYQKTRFPTHGTTPLRKMKPL